MLRLAASVILLSIGGCDVTGLHPRETGDASVDAGATNAIDAGLDPIDGGGATGLALAIDYADGECSDLSTPHSSPGYLLRFRASGPANRVVQLWAEKPACGVAPFVYRELTLDASGAAVLDLAHPGSSACDDSLIGGWRVWLEQSGARSGVVEAVIRSSACTGALQCATAATFCPATIDGGTPEPPPPVPVTEELARLDGAFFTPTIDEPMLRVDTVGRGTAYDRVEIELDFVAGDWQPEIPDEGDTDRTEHILFGLFRANQTRTDQRYLMGAAAVTFATRGPHFRMFGRTSIGDGYTTYVQETDTYGWTRGAAYHLRCVLDGVIDEQRCELSTDAVATETRLLAVTYLDPAMHLTSGFYVEIGRMPDAWGIETSPLGWEFSNLVVRGVR